MLNFKVLFNTNHVERGQLKTVPWFSKRKKTSKSCLVITKDHCMSHPTFMTWLKRGLIDLGSSINIMLLSMLEVVRIPHSRVIERLIEVLGFRGNTSFTLGSSMPVLLIIAARETLDPQV